MQTSEPFDVKKLRIIRNLSCVRTDKEVELARTFCGQGERKGNFSRFCADVLYGWPLICFFHILSLKIFIECF